MRPIDADGLEELFREVINGIAKKPEMSGNLEHMVRASAMVIEMIKDAPTIDLAEDLREKVISNMAEIDFVHVIRCQKCEQYRESQVVGWCDRYDEPKMKLSFCSEGKVRPGEKA